ncbi:TetR/AcrR family transcriptional regulator [Lysobacter solisilvae (ex Woo and Kim 2020)]|uniref:TetR/AcrR family transcriptional regulator n=1 Tax=Agrilutibacter terrestris TaxID=2865112 RepID=A0A7H0FZT2_9GAMM|nr:TetR/AcrR family transcriptional regulator [Lysobacter terrestris]QNP41548.1 TetR/AcrR family transcriptional regulator [Lysobacter terrestris]
MSSASSRTPAPKPASPGRPKDLGKRAAILDAAKRMFTAHGFERVSMDQIAADAGVSKLTVYSHFGDKETLFSAAISAKCEEQLAQGLFAVAPESSLREQLLGIGRAFLALINSEESLAIHRVVTTQPPPAKLGQLFWDAGPRRVQEAFEAFLRDEIAAGALDIPEVHRAASQFFCMLKGEMHMLLLCGCSDRIDAAETEAHVQATVDMFLRAYQAAPARKR